MRRGDLPLGQRPRRLERVERQAQDLRAADVDADRAGVGHRGEPRRAAGRRRAPRRERGRAAPAHRHCRPRPKTGARMPNARVVYGRTAAAATTTTTSATVEPISRRCTAAGAASDEEGEAGHGDHLQCGCAHRLRVAEQVGDAAQHEHHACHDGGQCPGGPSTSTATSGRHVEHGRPQQAEADQAGARHRRGGRRRRPLARRRGLGRARRTGRRACHRAAVLSGSSGRSGGTWAADASASRRREASES